MSADPFYAEFIPGAIAFLASRRHPSYIPIDHSPRATAEVSPDESPVGDMEWRRIQRNARLQLMRDGHPGIWQDTDKAAVRTLWAKDPELALKIAHHNGWIIESAALPHAA